MLSISLFGITGYYSHSQHNVVHIILFSFGILFLYFGCPDIRIYASPAIRYIIAILSIACALFINVPYNIGVVLLTVSMILHKKKVISKIMVVGTIINIMFLVYSILNKILFSRLHELTLIKYVIFSLMKVFFNDISSSQNNILLKEYGDYYMALPTAEQLQLNMIIIFIVLMTLLRFLSIIKLSWANILKSGIVLFVYMIFRYMFLVSLYPYFKSIEMFYSPIISLISFIPILLYIYLKCYVSNSIDVTIQVTRNVVALMMLFSLIITSAYIEDPGINNHSKIYIDEYHCEGWESVDEKLDENNFGGQKSVYTYTKLVDFLRNKYDVEIIRNKSFFKNIPEDSILIIKTPQKQFTTEDISCIKKFVEAGGGLFLIGDHTNLFGMNDYLNSITSDWGLNFNSDSVYDLQTTGLTTFKTNKILDHPIIGNVREYKFATSCSLSTSLVWNNIIVGNSTCSEEMDISHINFFGDFSPELTERWGVFTQCASRNVGRGRVVAFSDSTTFSTFSVYMHDNPEFILNIMNYLNKSNSFVTTLKSIIFVISTLGLILILILKRDKSFYSTLLIAVPIIFFLLNNILLNINYNNYNKRTDMILSDMPTLYFNIAEDSTKISHFIGLSGEGQIHNFSSLFLDFMRLNYFCREEPDLSKCITINSQGIVIINPENAPVDSIRNLKEYINNGGKLIIFDSFYKENNTNKLYAELGINKIRSFYQKESNSEKNHEETITSIMTIPSFYVSTLDASRKIDYFSVKGFDNIFYYQIIYGKGKIFIVGDSLIFSNMILGDPGIPPTKTQYNLHKEIFQIIKKICY